MINNRVLIINGISSSDELSKLGVDTANKFQKSNRVYLIDKQGKAKQIKYCREETLSEVIYIDTRDNI